MGKKPLQCVSNVFQLALEEFFIKEWVKILDSASKEV